MSVRLRVKVLAAAAALCVAGGASAMVTLNADAATPECGLSCTDIYSAAYGTSARPGYVLEAEGGGPGRLGQPVTLARASVTNPAEDFVLDNLIPASDYAQAGLVNGYLAEQYGCVSFVTVPGACPAGTVNDYAGEIQYEPYGAPTELCVGVGTSPAEGTPITLQECGVSGSTLWLINPVTPLPKPTGQPTRPTCGLDYFNGLASLISAVSSSVTNPYSMSTSFYPGSPLFTYPLIKNFKNQLWGANVGDIGAICTNTPTAPPT